MGTIEEKNTEENVRILSIDEWKEENISYDRMQGWPSVKLMIQGNVEDCLLDTGARVNVIHRKIFEKLTNVKLEKADIKLNCANSSQLDCMGKISVDVEIKEKRKNVTFIVVNDVKPDIIGGIELQMAFGIELHWKKKENDVNEQFYQVCNLEAKFGRKVTNEERFKRAMEIMKITEKPKIVNIDKKHQGVFMADKWDIGCTTMIKHRIDTKGPPINLKPHRQPVNLEEKIDETIKNLWENNIIKKCNSPWNTPMICVWKKEKNDVRICLDFRQLNLVTERQAFPMPNMIEMMDRLYGTRYFTSIDLGNAYYQVELEEDSKLKTAFSTKLGQFCFNRMPFGIAAAPGTFQELMTKVLGGIEQTVVYLDDILIFSKSLEQHYEALDKVLDQIGKAGLRINPEKCHILKTEVKFLGHVINDKGIQTDPSKLEAIKTFEKPKCVKNLRSFLGICNYYRRFIKDYATKAKTLEQLCGLNKKKLLWTDACDAAFAEMKEALTTPPILGFPDFQKEFILDTDASFDTIGAVLSQRDKNGRERVIAYGSHSMNNHEKGYCITRKELLAMYYFCQHFNHYLYGKRFTLRTDHKAITFMVKTKKPITAQFQTWINYLSSLDIRLEYRKGTDHSNADMLSRNTCDTCTQCLMAHEDAKMMKIKTRRINVLDTSQIFKYQQEEIEEIKRDPSSGKDRKLTIEDGIIRTNIGKIWIPKSKREEMIIQIHTLLSHAGAEKVTKYISENYDMISRNEIIKEVIGQCEACQKSKTLTTATKEKRVTLVANEPFEKVYIDICGPLKETWRRKKYIVAIIDQFSRYISLTAISKQDEITIKDTIMTKWILRFGAPKEIHTDCGKTFESKVIKDMAESMNIKMCYSSPYHHNTNGIVERQFRTIREYLNASLHTKKGSDWEELLPEIEFTLNATFQKTIGKSPAEIIFGKKIYREGWYSQDIKLQQEKEDTTTRRNFEIGDEVLVKVETGIKSKDKYEGPYKVVEKTHDRRYKLINEDGRILDRNVEKLRKFLKKGDMRG